MLDVCLIHPFLLCDGIMLTPSRSGTPRITRPDNEKKKKKPSDAMHKILQPPFSRNYAFRDEEEGLLFEETCILKLELHEPFCTHNPPE